MASHTRAHGSRLRVQVCSMGCSPPALPLTCVIAGPRRTVAVKRMKHHDLSATFLAYFEEEVPRLVALNHPNLLPLHGVCLQDFIFTLFEWHVRSLCTLRHEAACSELTRIGWRDIGHLLAKESAPVSRDSGAHRERDCGWRAGATRVWHCTRFPASYEYHGTIALACIVCT